MTVSTKLLPCPMCDSVFTQVRYIGWKSHSAFNSGYRGECCDCGLITATYTTESEAINAWNTRAERTCEVITSEFDGQMWVYRHEFSCDCGQRNYFTAYSEPPKYCPQCGAKVVCK